LHYEQSNLFLSLKSSDSDFVCVICSVILQYDEEISEETEEAIAELSEKVSKMHP
jgi:hypothetical protein